MHVWRLLPDVLFGFDELRAAERHRRDGVWEYRQFLRFLPSKRVQFSRCVWRRQHLWWGELPLGERLRFRCLAQVFPAGIDRRGVRFL